MKVLTLEVGLLQTNCYIVYDDTGCNGSDTADKECVIVDPGDDAGIICGKLKELGLTPSAILLTHGHFDHIGAVDRILGRYSDVKVYAGKAEDELLHDPELNCTARVGRKKTVNADRLIDDGGLFTEAGITFRVLATPGHTAGSVCYYVSEADVLFAGDTLFKGSMGRTDLPTGNEKQIFISLDRLAMLPDETVVYPGHGSKTGIGEEKRYNPFISGNGYEKEQY